ncbi:MAG: aminotransferase class I/II-fold pyridoxal phosphate-dependent enzyme [Myxococcaceae bacterium]
MSGPRLPAAQRVAGLGTTVFSEFSALANEHGAVNLGQGFPDFDGPLEVKEAAVQAINGGLNQYAIGSGAVELRRAIAEHQARFYGQKLDPQTMISVTSGATEAIFDTILGIVDPGDEVIIFEPFYDSYVPAVEMAGGVCRYVLLRPADGTHPTWWFDEGELRAAFSDKTRLVIVNTPHNPTGKVYTRAELSLIGELCRKHGAFILSDEVYEHIVFEPARHVPTATVEGLGDRVVTVSSGGKTFSFTGWKIGWAIGAPPLRTPVQNAHQFITFATAAPFQHAIAHALRMTDSFYAELQRDYAKRRDKLCGALRDCGFRVLVPEGTYFAMVDLEGTGFDDDFAFCRHLTTKVGVAAIPPSAFYSAEHKKHGQRFARFAFCKTDAVLDRAAERLRSFRSLTR